MIQYDPLSPVNNNVTTARAVTSQPSIPLTKAGYGDSGTATDSDESGNFESFNGSPNWFALIGSVIGNIINYFQQRKLQKEQQQFQYDYFDYTQSKQNQEYWKRVEYDTPFRQLQRLKDAGLNENLLYGSLGNAAGIAGNAPASPSGGLTGSIPTALPFFDTNSIIQAMFAPSQIMSQIGLNNSQAYKNYKSAGVDDAQANRLSLLTPYEVEKYQQDIDFVSVQVGKASAEVESLSMDNYVKEVSLGILAKIKEEELRLLQAQVFATRQKGDYDNAARLRMEKEISIVLPALANSYNASASEKWQTAVRLQNTLVSYTQEMSNRANVSKQEAESYFYREVLPRYLDLGIDATKLILSKGMSTTEFFDSNGQIVGGKITRNK